ncbi:MAG TPA: hypothetical protein VFJ17_09205 [Mycobacteriales bacterium]|jgi:hypothetical protein|nr:hypothetical protein [Mycobacteriales bacterium]
MRRRSSSLVLAASTAGVLALAGCGSGSGKSVPKDPKGELTASVSNLGDTDTLTSTIKLEIPAAELQQLAKANGDNLTSADAAAISSAQLVLEAKTTNGKKFADLKPSDQKATAVAIRGISGGHTYLEMRVISGDLYLQGDVKGFLGLIHQDKSYAEVKARAASLPDFVKALVDGRWVSLNGAAAQGLASQFGVQAGGTSGNGAQSTKMLDDLKRLLNKDVTVTRVGSDSQGDHLRLSGNAKTLANDAYQSFASVVPGGGAALSQAKPQSVPSRVVTLDAWVKDGVLTQISLDLGQFASKGDPAAGKKLPVTLAFSQDGDDISKPSDVTPIDLTQLGSLMGALGGGTSG